MLMWTMSYRILSTCIYSIANLARWLQFLCFHSHPAIALPLPAPILALIYDKYQYVVTSFPSVSCLPYNSDFMFYSMVLILDILLALALCLFILLFWAVHKVRIQRLLASWFAHIVRVSVCVWIGANCPEMAGRVPEVWAMSLWHPS